MAAYTPTDVPLDPKQLPDWLRREMASIAQSFVAQAPFVYLQTLNVAPTKPREGLVILVDGTHFNPGSGAGFYGYRGGAWHLLG